MIICGLKYQRNRVKSFVEKGGFLLEFDGRKPFPINQGPCAADGLVEAAIQVIKSDFMATDPGSFSTTFISKMKSKWML